MSKRRKRRHNRSVAVPPKDPTIQTEQPVILGDIGQGDRQLSRQDQRQRARVSFTAESWQGPLPHPETLARFNEIHPGASGIIFGEFQAQSAHRRDLESRVVRSNIRNSTLGQVFAFIILSGIVAGGVFLIDQDKDVAGFGVIVSAVIGGLWALGAAIKAKKEDLAKKREPEGKKK